MFRTVAFAAFPPFPVGDRIYETGSFSLGFSEEVPGWKAGGKWETRSRFLFFLIVILRIRHWLLTSILWTDTRRTEKLAFDLLSNRSWFSLTTINGVITIIHQSAIRVDLQLDVEGRTDNICSRFHIVPVLPVFLNAMSFIAPACTQKAT